MELHLTEDKTSEQTYETDQPNITLPICREGGLWVSGPTLHEILYQVNHTTPKE
jgi:hypothetical protein